MNHKMVFQNDTCSVSVHSLYFVGGYITYEVSISTCGFTGTSNFCIEENKLNEYIYMIDIMINTLSGEVSIDDSESDAYLKFYFENRTSLFVVGQVGGSHEDNVLKFKLMADQTALYGLKENLLDY